MLTAYSPRSSDQPTRACALSNAIGSANSRGIANPSAWLCKRSVPPSCVASKVPVRPAMPGISSPAPRGRGRRSAPGAKTRRLGRVRPPFQALPGPECRVARSGKRLAPRSQAAAGEPRSGERSELQLVEFDAAARMSVRRRSAASGEVGRVDVNVVRRRERQLLREVRRSADRPSANPRVLRVGPAEAPATRRRGAPRHPSARRQPRAARLALSEVEPEAQGALSARDRNRQWQPSTPCADVGVVETNVDAPDRRPPLGHRSDHQIAAKSSGADDLRRRRARKAEAMAAESALETKLDVLERERAAPRVPRRARSSPHRE